MRPKYTFLGKHYICCSLVSNWSMVVVASWFGEYTGVVQNQQPACVRMARQSPHLNASANLWQEILFTHSYCPSNLRELVQFCHEERAKVSDISQNLFLELWHFISRLCMCTSSIQHYLDQSVAFRSSQTNVGGQGLHCRCLKNAIVPSDGFTPSLKCVMQS